MVRTIVQRRRNRRQAAPAVERFIHHLSPFDRDHSRSPPFNSPSRFLLLQPCSFPLDSSSFTVGGGSSKRHAQHDPRIPSPRSNKDKVPRRSFKNHDPAGRSSRQSFTIPAPPTATSRSGWVLQKDTNSTIHDPPSLVQTKTRSRAGRSKITIPPVVQADSPS